SKNPGSRKTFLAICSGVATGNTQQIEFLEGDDSAHILDVTTRREVARCRLKLTEVAQLIKGYEERSRAVEYPPCYLTQWHGQMMYVAKQIHGRCSFNMNKKKLDEFKLQ